MIDLNKQLRISLLAVLDNIAPTYYMQVPDSDNEPEYIVITSINNSNESTAYKNDVRLNVQLTVSSYYPKYNDGIRLDQICDSILSQINNSIVFGTNAAQIYEVRLLSDNVGGTSIQQERTVLERTMAYQFRIFIK
jgi:hypothetical protein